VHTKDNSWRFSTTCIRLACNLRKKTNLENEDKGLIITVLVCLHRINAPRRSKHIQNPMTVSQCVKETYPCDHNNTLPKKKQNQIQCNKTTNCPVPNPETIPRACPDLSLAYEIN
jgi:hypothetical protein